MNIRKNANAGELIVRAESVAAWRDGEQFLEQAKKDAAAMKMQSTEDARAAREKAWQQGFEQGRQAGLEDAAKLALQITAERDAYLNSLTLRLMQSIDACMKKILADMDDAQLIAGVARKAIEDLRKIDKVTLRVPPGMASVIEKLVSLPGAKKINVKEDDTLQDSLCYLETPLGVIQLSAQTQWERIFRVMSANERGDQ